MALTATVSPRVGEVLYQMGFLITTQNQVDAVYLSYFLGFQLGITTSNDHKGPWVLAHHAPYGCSALTVGHLGYRAGINQADISLLTFGHSSDPHLLKRLAKG